MIASGWTINDKFATIDHVSFLSEAKRLGVPTAHWENRVGRIMWPGGPSPGMVGLLVHRAVLTAMDLNDYCTITFRRGVDEVVLYPMVICEAPMRVFGGKLNDPSSVYFVRFADKRWMALNPHFGSHCVRQFNVRAPNGGPYEFYTSTVPGGATDPTPYTWQEVLDELWSEVFADPGYSGEGSSDPLAGSSPLLPFTPDQDPINIRFEGVPAWAAYNEVLRRLGCMFALNPSDGVGSIVRIGDDSDDFDQATEAFSRDILLDGEYEDIVLGKTPKQVVVLFHIISSDYGTEDTTSPFLDWSMYSIHQETIDLADLVDDEDDVDNLTNKVWSSSKAYVWDDMRAILNVSTGAVENQDDLTQRATSRARDILRTNYTTGNKLYKTYKRLITHAGFLPNSQIKAISWVDDGVYGHGPRTEIMNAPSPVAVSQDKDEWSSLYGEEFREFLKPPDYARQTYPNYPVHLQLVRVESTVPDPDTGLYPGTIVYVSPDTGELVQKESCWVFDPNA